MSKTVVINIGSGDLYHGFPRVTAQLWTQRNQLPRQFIGSLPPAAHLVELCRNWQLHYRSLCARQRLRYPAVEDDDFEIDTSAVTNISVMSFDELCHELQQSINQWLSSPEFVNISRQVRSHLDPAEEIHVIMETSDDLLRRLPWHRSDFYRDYPRSEMALAQPEYKQVQLSQSKLPSQKVRILAVLGNSVGIDLATEARFLHSLPDSEVVFLVNPTRQELNTQLWDAIGWDIFFFAGHSQTEGETGRIYINENKTNNSLTIEQLEEGLKAAIDKGLHLAIFNSCDGLGLASALENLHIPTVIVMREPVPNLVAQKFFQYFMQAFAVERLSFYLAVQQARRKLQGLEDDFPGASWLPVICINPAVEPPTWLKLGGIPPCPYRGLFAFQQEDAHLFFGREQFTQELGRAVKKKPLVAVVGPSGSGKSSVVFAGLIPQLRQQNNVRWQIVSFRPGNNPIAALAEAIAPLWNSRQTEAEPRVARDQAQLGHENLDALHPDENNQRLVELELEIALRQDKKALHKVVETIVHAGSRFLLIADQFEELFTQTPESERQHLIDVLLTACNHAPAFTVVLTLRADFYGHALSYRPLSDALQGAVQNLGPMSRQELRRAIEEPAAKMQVGLEKELTNTLIYAVEEQSGRLPLLEFALTQLWSKQKSGLLTHEAYQEIGGVEEAVGTHAEVVYAQLDKADKIRTQRVFMQLVRLGDGVEATRRLATRDQVKPENWDLVTRLASSRLVVTNRNANDEETVEIVHEALIKNWGRLEHWIQVDGEFRRWQEQLRATMQQWEISGQDEGVLLRGKPLADAEYWQQQRQEELSSGEGNFIELSLAQRDSEINKYRRRRQLTISGLSTGLAIALSLAGIAGWLWQKARIIEIQAYTQFSEALFASNNRLDALIEALRAMQKLKKVGGVNVNIRAGVESALEQAVYGAVEYNRLLGHGDNVFGVTFSPDGQLIASASGDMTVKLWQRDGTLFKTLSGHSDKVFAVAFSPDSQLIATASADNTVKLWRRDGTLLTTLNGHTDKVVAVVFSPDHQLIATGGDDKTIKLWKPDGTRLNTLTGHIDRVSAVAFSPDSNTIVSASWDKTVKLWQRDGTLITTIKNAHSDKVSAVAFSPDGNTIASASWDKTVKLWNRDGTLRKVFNDDSGRVFAVAFSPNGNTIASAGQDKTIKLWKLDGKLLTILRTHRDTVWGVAFSPDGNTIASASNDKTVKLWKLDNTLLTTLCGNNGGVWGVAFSPDGQLIATSGEDKTVKLWRRDGTRLKTFNGHIGGVWGVAFSPDGQIIASASRDKTIKLWKLDGTLLTTIKGHNDVVNAVAFSPDGQIIASASDDKTVKLWRRDGSLLNTLTGHNNEVWGVTFSPDGQMIVSTSRDKTVKFWKLDGTRLKTINGHTGGVWGAAFSPDGQIIATGSEDNTVKLWKRDGTKLTTLKGHDGRVLGVAFSPDGRMIATSSDDKTVKVWKRDGTLLTTLKGHSAPVWRVAFSPNGSTIASASDDGTAILWNLDRVRDENQLLTYGCHWVSDYLRTNPQIPDGLDAEAICR